MRVELAMLLALGLLTSPAFAQFELDPSFGIDDNPYFYTHFSNEDIWYDAAVGDDSYIYFTGWISDPVQHVFGSVSTEGTVNPGYAPFYNVNNQIPGNSSSNGYSIELQSNNKPVAAGITIEEGAEVSSIFVSRAGAVGISDPLFADLGYYRFNPDGVDCFVGDVMIAPNDDIFILGRSRAPNNGNFSYLIIKLDAEGNPDESFGDNGVVEFNSGSSNRYLTHALYLDNGQLLVSGTDNNKQLMRINANGTLDLDFGNDGYIAISGYTEIISMAQFEDEFFAFGSGGGVNASVYKFNEEELDEDYGELGVADLDFVGFTQDAIMTEEGDIYFTGFYQGSSYVAAADTSGAMSTTFVQGGESFISISENNTALQTIVQLGDGSLIVAGSAISLMSEVSGSDFVAYKLSFAGGTGVDDQSEQNLRVFPSVFSETIALKSDGPLGEVVIKNLQGQLVFEGAFSEDETLLDLSFLSKGSYILVQENKGQAQVQRIIKQ